jgi:hypothetical protein
MEEIGDDDVEVRAEWVSLPKPAATLYVGPQDPVEQHGRAPHGEECMHPATPLAPEATKLKDHVKVCLADEVECLPEVQLKDHDGDLLDVAALDNLCGEREVVGDRSPLDEHGNRRGDGALQPVCEDLGSQFWGVVLQTDWSEIGSGDGAQLLGEEDNVRLCNTLKFYDFKMLLGRIIKQQFWRSFKILLNIYFLYRKLSS